MRTLYRFRILAFSALFLLTGCAVPAQDAHGAARWEALALDAPFSKDMDGDGAEEELTVFTGAGSGGADAVFLRVRYGGEERTQQLMQASFFSAYSVEIPSEKPVRLLAVSGIFEGAAPNTLFFSVKNGSATEDLRADGGVRSVRQDGVVMLEDRIDILGTWYGEREYAMGPDASFAPARQSLWRFDGAAWPLHVKKPLAVQMENGDGTYADKTLPAGTTLCLYAWDGASYVLFALEDGARGKLSYTGEPAAVLLADGTSAEEWLEDIVYTG